MDISNREGVAALFFAVSLTGCAASPDASSPRALVERALGAMDVALEPGAGEGLVVEAWGVLNQGVERQGRDPESLDPGAFGETLAVDVASERLAYEYRLERYDGREEWIRDLYQNDRRTIGVRHENFALALESEELVAERRSLWRRLPHLLLREALASGPRLHALPSEGLDPRVGLELPSGETLVLLLGGESGLLSRVEYVTDLQSFGDTEVIWSFSDYQPVEGFGLVPRRYAIAVEERPYVEMQVERVSVDPEDWAAVLALPDGMEEPEVRKLPAGRDPSAGARVETVAPGVHVVRSLRLGFHPMFVELGDSIVAIDAPAGYRLLTQLPAGDVAPGPSAAWLSERYLELIEAAVPGKPVRYVVLTHFHNDHAGGVRAFVARGATVVGPASARAAVEGLVAAPHRVAPDALASAPQELLFTDVEDVLRLGNDSRAVEIVSIGPNPHTDAMLVVHLPAEGILFSSDLMELEGVLRGLLTARGLEPERIFSMHAAEPATLKELP